MPTQVLNTPRGSYEFARDLNQTIGNIGSYFLQSAQMRQQIKDRETLNRQWQQEMAMKQQQFAEQKRQFDAQQKRLMMPSSFEEALVQNALRQQSAGAPTMPFGGGGTSKNQGQYPIRYSQPPSMPQTLGEAQRSAGPLPQRVPMPTAGQQGAVQPSGDTMSGFDPNLVDAYRSYQKWKETPTQEAARIKTEKEQKFWENWNPDKPLSTEELRFARQENYKIRKENGKYYIGETEKPTAMQERFALIDEYLPENAEQLKKDILQGKPYTSEIDEQLKQYRLADYQRLKEERAEPIDVAGAKLPGLSNAQKASVMTGRYDDLVTNAIDMTRNVGFYSSSKSQLDFAIKSRDEQAASIEKQWTGKDAAKKRLDEWELKNLAPREAAYKQEVTMLGYSIANNLWAQVESKVRGKTPEQATNIIKNWVKASTYSREIKADPNLETAIYQNLENLYNAHEAASMSQ